MMPHSMRLSATTVFMCILLVLAIYPAHAALFEGSSRGERISGTNRADTIRSYAGNDTIYAKDGPDKIYPGSGDDRVFAGAGDDLIYARDTSGKDYIDCGPGFDKVETIHRDDRTLSNCERALGPDRGDI